MKFIGKKKIDVYWLDNAKKEDLTKNKHKGDNDQALTFGV